MRTLLSSIQSWARHVRCHAMGLRDDESGATAVEYAVMLGLIIGVCFVAVGNLSTATDASFNQTAAAIAGAFN